MKNYTSQKTVVILMYIVFKYIPILTTNRKEKKSKY